MAHYGLREAVGACPQTYALGLKEVWEVPEEVSDHQREE
jgi:flavin-dependent dehydrogenase